MIFWSLLKISEAAGGAMPFDMRPFGYGFDEAKAFLGALSPEGAAFYLNVQHRLDAAYPALLAATLFFAIRALAPGAGPVPTLLAVVALPGAAFDYLENASVTAMLHAGASGLTPELAARASLWTLLNPSSRRSRCRCFSPLPERHCGGGFSPAEGQPRHDPRHESHPRRALERRFGRRRAAAL